MKEIRTALIIICLVVFEAVLFVVVVKTANYSIVHVVAEPNFTDVVSQSIKSVVHIRCPQWQGSGFIISKHIICTARHVVENVEDFEITFNNGKKIKAIRAISDKKYDIGFIWIEEDMNNVVKIGNSKNCKLGQNIYIIGSPYGKKHFNALTVGILSMISMNVESFGITEDYGWEVLFMSDTATWGGSSGSPVFTKDGIVRGVLVGGHDQEENTSYCVPCDLFLSDIEQIRLMFLINKYQFEEKPKYSFEGKV